MKIAKNAKIELATSRDANRTHLTSAYLDTDAKCIVATAGHYLVQVPVEVEEGDTTGLISVEALKEARKQAGKGDSRVGANGALTFANGGQMPRPTEDDCGKFPPYDKVIPSDPGDTTLALNAAMLFDICQALGGSKRDANVVLTFTKAEEGKPMLSPITVTLTTAEGKAVLMPVRV